MPPDGNEAPGAPPCEDASRVELGMKSARASEKRLRRIGIPTHGFGDWGGGIDFLRLIASSLRHADPAIELHVLIPARGIRTRWMALKGLLRSALRGTGRTHRPVDIRHIELAFADTRATLHLIDHGAFELRGVIRRLDLDAILPTIHPLSGLEIPWVGYIYDFQHKHLPQFFTREERKRRDRAFERMLNSADSVIVNARQVAKDIEHFYPERRARVFAMPFAPAPSEDAFSIDVGDAMARYGISAPYFIVCNQFWKHKDHRTAFEAFALAARDRPDLQLVCTGATVDYRFPDYFDQLMQDAVRLGIVERVRVLGLIPKPDQFALLRGAIALIQPTLFEGGPGGGAVFDAVAVGQRAIVSDIAVNAEIDERCVSFFATGDSRSLAERMNSALSSPRDISTVIDVSELLSNGIERRKKCGKVLLASIKTSKREGS